MAHLDSLLSQFQDISSSDMYAAAKVARDNTSRAIARWESMARECARQGFAPEYCIHGTRMWVDYDCACWQCEMGDDPRELSLSDHFDSIKAWKIHYIARVRSLIKDRDSLVESGMYIDMADRIIRSFPSSAVPSVEDVLNT